MQFTACYTKLEHGYMGQLLEWPNVITEGDDLEDCEKMLKDAAHEMMITYQDDGVDIPQIPLVVKPISISDDFTEVGGYHDVLSNGEGKYITIKRADTFDEYTVKAMCKETGIPDMLETLNMEDAKI